MSTVVGHGQVRAILEKELPPVTLLLGPAGTGKLVLAEHLVEHHRIHKADTIRIFRLTADVARELVARSRTIAPGTVKVVVIVLDEATEQAQNILLKVLEAPPAPVRFLLLASRPPLPTVISRSRVFRTGLLSEEEVEAVLSQLGVPGSGKYAAMSKGTVAGALEASSHDSEDARRVTGMVGAALRLAAARDHEGLSAALRGWESVHCLALFRWAGEAVSGQWLAYTADLAPGVTSGQALAVWSVLRSAPSSRLTASVALHDAFWGKLWALSCSGCPRSPCVRLRGPAARRQCLSRRSSASTGQRIPESRSLSSTLQRSASMKCGIPCSPSRLAAASRLSTARRRQSRLLS